MRDLKGDGLPKDFIKVCIIDYYQFIGLIPPGDRWTKKRDSPQGQPSVRSEREILVWHLGQFTMEGWRISLPKGLEEEQSLAFMLRLMWALQYLFAGPELSLWSHPAGKLQDLEYSLEVCE